MCPSKLYSHLLPELQHLAHEKNIHEKNPFHAFLLKSKLHFEAQLNWDLIQKSFLLEHLLEGTPSPLLFFRGQSSLTTAQPGCCVGACPTLPL